MKSIFTNLGKLLLCGVVVAMVGCTDFKEDIRVVDEKVNSLTESTTADKATLTQTLDALKKDVTDNYYTKQQIDAVQDALEKSISDEVKGIEDQIKGLNDAITAATNAATAAIADLDGKKADKATVEAAQKKAEDAIAALQEALEGVKTTHSADIKKLEDQIAAAKKDLEGKVGANTTAITALEGQVKTLGAQILELQNMAMSMGIQLQEDMNAIAAELGEEIDAVDAKALELKNDLVALTDHLNEYEQTTDLKLTELNGSLQALSVYLEEYEKEIDLKLTELHGSLQALSVYLAENMVTGEDFAFKMAEVDGAITALNNLLSDLGEQHEKDINEVYAEISKRFDETNGALTTVLELIEGLAAEDETIYNELNLTKEMLTTVFNNQLALKGEVSTIKATLDARKEAAEAFKAEYDKKIAELEAEDKSNTDLIHSIGTALDSYVEDINAELELVNAEFTKVREEMTSILNLLTDAHQADMDELWKELKDRKEVTDGAITALNNLVGDLQKEDEYIYAEINYVKEFATKNLADINALKATVETLNDALEDLVSIDEFKNWEAGHVEEHNNLLTMITNINTYIDEELEEIKADAAYDRKQCQETATALNNLIGDVAKDLAKLRAEFDERMNHYDSFENDVADKLKGLDKVIESLEDRLNKRIGALEEEVGKIKVDVAALTEALGKLQYTFNETLKNLKDEDKAIRTEMEFLAGDIEKLYKLVGENKDAIGKNADDIKTNAGAIADLVLDLARVEGLVNAGDAKLSEQINGLFSIVSKDIDAVEGAIEAVKGLVKAEAEAAKSQNADLEERLNNKITALEKQLNSAITTVLINSSMNTADIANLKAATDDANKFLQGQIDDLVNRVQSLVYVPKYSDNLAYMEYARIMIDRKNQPNQSFECIFAAGLTDLTYKVNAKDAVAVADALAKSWQNNPETFDYDVTDVKTRGASERGADLEIVNVAAEDQYITVTVKPIAFNAKHFWAASHDDDDGIYSASLVISDSEKNNFRATEYLNLVPEAKARADKFIPVVRIYDENDGYIYDVHEHQELVYSDTDTTLTLLKTLEFGFVDKEDNFITPETLAEQGYAFEVNRNIVQTYRQNDCFTLVDPNNPNTIVPGLLNVLSFMIENKAQLSADEKGNTTIKHTEEVKISEIGREYHFDYNFIFKTPYGESVTTAQSCVEIIPEIVEVILDTAPVDWTYELALALSPERENPYYGAVHSIPVDLSHVDTEKVNIENILSDPNVTATGASALNVTEEKYDYVPYSGYYPFEAVFTDGALAFNVKKSYDKFSMVEGASNHYRTTWEVEYVNVDENAHYETKVIGYVHYNPIPSYEVDAEGTLKEIYDDTKGLCYTGPVALLDGLAEKFAFGATYTGNKIDALYNDIVDATINGLISNADNQWGTSDEDLKAYTPAELSVKYASDSNTDKSSITAVAALVDHAATESKYLVHDAIEFWNGVNVKFNVDLNVTLPSYALATHPTYVVDDIAEVEAIFDGGVYTVKGADPKHYFYVENGDEKIPDYVTVQVEAEKVSFDHTFAVRENDGALTQTDPATVIEWGTYKYLTLPVKATLLVADIEYATKDITLVVKDPILSLDVNEYKVKRQPNSITPANPLNALEIKTVARDEAYSGSDFMLNEASKYGAVITMKLDKVYYEQTKTVAGTQVTADVDIPDNWYDFDETTGDFVIGKEAAGLAQSIFAKFTVSLAYNLDCEEPKTAEVIVEFETPNTEFANQLTYALTNGGSIALAHDVNVVEPLVINAPGKTVTIDLNNFSMNQLSKQHPENPALGPSPKSNPVLEVQGGTLIINGKGTVNGGVGNGNMAICVRNGARVIINGGTFHVGQDDTPGVSGNSCIYVFQGEALINGGEFSTEEAGDSGEYFVLNCTDANYTNGTAKISVTSGIFHNFNPGNNKAEGVGTNFVADGFKSVANPDGTYSVVAK